MKFTKLAKILGLEGINVKSGIFGGKPFASFNEEQLDTIEEALAEQSNAELQARIATLEKDVQENAATNLTIENAVNAALEKNGLEVGVDLADSIAILGTTCKEYGEKKVIHTRIDNDGKEINVDDELVEGFIDPNASHNQLLGIGQKK